MESIQTNRIGKLNSNRAHVEWVNIEEILPNPLNPRKDDGIKTEDLQAIIKKQGWETPITCYKKGMMYVVLSGHRRLFAAKKVGTIKQIPVFVVEAPKTHQEEIERIASAQLAAVNWSSMEWGRFCYERWLAWGRPPMRKFAESLKLPKRTVEAYVNVLDYFPMDEIEAGINNKTFTMAALEDIWYWIRALKKTKPKLVEQLTEEMIRRLLLEKHINKKVSRESLRKKDFLDLVSDEDVKKFFLDKPMHLEELMAKYEVKVSEKTFHAQTVSVGLARKAVKNFSPKNREEAKKAVELLKAVQEQLEAQLKNITKKYPDAVEKKDNLFDWK
jgi:ParB family chromosome partitioning protein